MPALRNTILLNCLLGAWCAVTAQTPRMNDAAAKDAVHRIVQQSGLTPAFTVRADGNIRTANAFIKGGERIIAYNPAFINAVLDSTRTDWAAVSVLAHEIAHHLLGHTLDPDAMHPGDELACDRYSGFILQRLGATLAESLAAMEMAGNIHGTRHHPPRHARLAAITQGWEEADRLACHEGTAPFVVDRDFQFVVHFAGDDNTYYVDAEGCLVWFNDLAAPIGFGSCTRLPAGPYAYEITWEDQSFTADAKGILWKRGANGMDRQVGSMEAFTAEDR